MIIHTGQIVIDLGFHIPGLPPAGGDVFAHDADTAVGGGFPVMVAARGVGADVEYAGALGTGPWSDLAVKACREYGITHSGPVLDGDLGVSVVLTDTDAERTFISHRGVETCDLGQPDIGPGDLLYVTGYSCIHPKVTPLRKILTDVPPGQTIVDVSPMVGEISDDDLDLLVRARPIWTMNNREALILGRRFGQSGNIADLAAGLREILGSPVVVRLGQDGSLVASTEVTHIPALEVEAVDTNGAGDVYTGVLAGLINQGMGIMSAARYASVAASLSVTVTGAVAQYTQADLEHYLP